MWSYTVLFCTSPADGAGVSAVVVAPFTEPALAESPCEKRASVAHR